MSNAPNPESRLTLSAQGALNLPTAAVAIPQFTEIRPRWLSKLLPRVDAKGRVYRAGGVAKASQGGGAGSLVLTGGLPGWLVARAGFGRSGFVGAGLVFAGITDFRGMGLLPAKMPWNSRVHA